ncbi:MAG: S-layer homology domain-containing protein [Oscillospiraceae bacterium]
MNKKIRIILATVLVFALAAGIGITTFSQSDEPTVILDGDARAFSFVNTADTVDGDDPNPDLFVDMKNVMPGDTVEQKILLRTVNFGSRSTAKISLRVEASDSETDSADYGTLLDSPYVTLQVYSGDTLLSSEDLGTGVVLAQLRGNTSTELTVKLVIDKQAGNEIAGLNAAVDWVFYAEVNSSSTPVETSIPETGVPGGPLPELDTEDHYAYIIGRDDGLIHPNDNITRAEMATIFFRMLTDDSRAQFWTQTNDFSDVAITAWYDNAVSTLTTAGVVNGRDDGSFDPNAPITRAEFAAMLSRFYDSQYEGEDLFSDISGNWAEDAINKAAMNNLIEGYPDGTFRPSNYITRAEAITGINRILGRTPDMDYFLDDMITWPDNSDTSAWYYEAIQEATNSHDYEFVMDASGTFSENWTELLDVRDWSALETEWATLYGTDIEVISSK